MHPDALFKLFGRGVYLYGICIGVGLLACIFCFYYFTKKRGMSQNVQDFCIAVAVPAIALGFLFAKLFQAIYVWIDTGVFNFYSAGLTVMGGLIGGASCYLLLYFVCGNLFFKGPLKGVHVVQFKYVLLVAPLCILVAHAFGRIGCLMAGCCHGTYLGSEYVPGGIYMYGTVEGMHKWGYYIPTQLYESLFLFLTFGALSFLLIKGFNYIFPVYLGSYAIFRFVIEFLRADYRGFVEGGLSPSQWQSILFLVGGVIYFLVLLKLKTPFFDKQVKKISE